MAYSESKKSDILESILFTGTFQKDAYSVLAKRLLLGAHTSEAARLATNDSLAR